MRHYVQYSLKISTKKYKAPQKQLAFHHGQTIERHYNTSIKGKKMETFANILSFARKK